MDGLELIRSVRRTLPPPANRIPAAALTTYARSRGPCHGVGERVSDAHCQAGKPGRARDCRCSAARTMSSRRLRAGVGQDCQRSVPSASTFGAPRGTVFARYCPPVKVRIKETPREAELDGVELDKFKPGMVRDVSPILGSWLIAERYAVPEMRRSVRDHEEDFSTVQDSSIRGSASDHPRRRSDD